MPPRKNTITTLQNASDQSDSRLFSLAPELRNHIYELVFDGSEVRIKETPDAKGRTRVLGILMACKQAYVETLQLHFSMSTLQFYDRNRMIKWLRNIGSIHRRLITRIDFCVPVRMLPPAIPAGKRLDKVLEILKVTNADLEKQQINLPPSMLKLKVVSSSRGRWLGGIYEFYVAEDGSEGIFEV